MFDDRPPYPYVCIYRNLDSRCSAFASIKYLVSVSSICLNIIPCIEIPPSRLWRQPILDEDREPSNSIVCFALTHEKEKKPRTQSSKKRVFEKSVRHFHHQRASLRLQGRQNSSNSGTGGCSRSGQLSCSSALAISWSSSVTSLSRMPLHHAQEVPSPPRPSRLPSSPMRRLREPPT